MADFVPGLELGEQFYTDAAKPIIDTYFPGLRYSAAMLGWSSEVLGYDDVESTDHNWGPRFQLFLSSQDYEKYQPLLRETLSHHLPLAVSRPLHQLRRVCSRRPACHDEGRSRPRQSQN